MSRDLAYLKHSQGSSAVLRGKKLRLQLTVDLLP